MNQKIKLNGKTLVIIDWANVYGWSKKLRWEVCPEKLYKYLKDQKGVYDIRFYFGEEKGNANLEQFYQKIENIGFSFIKKEVKWVPTLLENSHFKKLIEEVFESFKKTKKTNEKISNNLNILTKIIENIINESYGVSTTGEMTYAFFDEKEIIQTFNFIDLLKEELKKLNLNIKKLQKKLKEPIRRRKCDFDCEISRDILLNIDNFDNLILFSGDGDFKVIIDKVLEKGKKVILVFGKGCKGKEYEQKNGFYQFPINRIKKLVKK